MKKENMVNVVFCSEEFPWLISGILLAPQVNLLAIAGEDASLTLFSLSSGSIVCSLAIPSDVLTLSFSSDGALLAASLENGDVYVWTNEGELIELIHAEKQVSVAFVPHTWLLSLVTQDGGLSLWDLLPARMVTCMESEVKHTREIWLPETYALHAYSFDGAQVAIDMTCSEDEQGCMRVLDVVSSQEKPMLQNQRVLLQKEGVMRDLVYRPGTHEIFVVIDESIIGIDVKTQHLVTAIQISGVFPYLISFSPDGNLLAFADGSGKIFIWHMHKRRVLTHFAAVSAEWEPFAPFTPVTGLMWSKQSDLLITAGWQRWNKKQGRQGSQKGTEHDPLYWSVVKLWKFRQ